MLSTRLTTRLGSGCSVEQTENIGAKMVPLYAARIEDLGPGDFVKVDCAGCHHVALLTPHSDAAPLFRHWRSSPRINWACCWRRHLSPGSRGGQVSIDFRQLSRQHETASGRVAKGME